jgi:hypothetical protein
MRQIVIAVFMIFGMMSYAQQNYTSSEHMVVTPSFEQESHIEDCYFTVNDSIVLQTNKTRDSILHTYRIGIPEKEGEIETTLKILKYSNNSFDIELNEYYVETKKTSRVLYYIDDPALSN